MRATSATISTEGDDGTVGTHHVFASQFCGGSVEEIELLTGTKIAESVCANIDSGEDSSDDIIDEVVGSSSVVNECVQQCCWGDGCY